MVTRPVTRLGVRDFAIPRAASQITASAGASWLPDAASDDEETSVDLTFRAADLALYRAKGLGRNRFAIDDERSESATDVAPNRADIRA